MPRPATLLAHVAGALLLAWASESTSDTSREADHVTSFVISRVVLTFFALGGVAAAAPKKLEPDTLTVPAPEVTKFDTGLQLPAVPSFELPPAEPGFVDPRTLRVDGKKLLDTEVKAKGYIVWVYDCMADVVRPGVSRAQAKKRIDADPTLCERPKLYLASTRDTPLEQAYEAFSRANALRPGISMYVMWTGVASYEATVTAAREAQAAKQGVDGKETS